MEAVSEKAVMIVGYIDQYDRRPYQRR